MRNIGLFRYIPFLALLIKHEIGFFPPERLEIVSWVCPNLRNFILFHPDFRDFSLTSRAIPASLNNFQVFLCIFVLLRCDLMPDYSFQIGFTGFPKLYEMFSLFSIIGTMF
jgi:hypothetical protein